MTPRIAWPDGKRFAFTVFDDTDLATVDNVREVYAFLRDIGLCTTKSCWMVQGDPQRGRYAGQTCEDADYLRWLLDLQSQGFEIGWHGATWHGLPRQQILAALEKFTAVFHHDPHTASNHSEAEGIYWGDSRLTGLHAFLYNLMTAWMNRSRYHGHVEGDKHFWGDLCKQKIKYYRNFVFRDVNTLKECPFMPYHDPKRPWVNCWFASSDGSRVNQFNRCLSEANQDRLEEEGGACIMYTHFACDFFGADRRVNPRFEFLMRRLTKKNGWFAPVGALLDFLQRHHGGHVISDAERRRLERKWLWQKTFIGTD